MCTDRKAGREGSKNRQRDRDTNCRTNNGGQVTGNRTEQSVDLTYPMSAVHLQRKLLVTSSLLVVLGQALQL